MLKTNRRVRYRESTRVMRLCGVLILGLPSGACEGVVVSGAGNSNGNGASGDDGTLCMGDVCSPPGAVYHGPGEAPMRRLNNAEYGNTVFDLFASGTQVAFPDEGRTHGFDTVNTALAVSQLHIEAYLNAAEGIVDELFQTDPGGIRAGWCNYQSADAAANLTCVRTIASDFAQRAWRRPLAAWPDGDATSEYLALLESNGALAAFSLETRLRTALEAILVSPRFVYRVEFADADGNLDAPSLASRLSYFLWSSAPDAELLASKLHDETVLAAQAERMRDDQRFSRFLHRFPDLWLDLEALETVERDPVVYPAFSPTLAVKMLAETRGFVTDLWLDPQARVSDILLREPPAVSDADLLTLYGDSPRRGLMTQAAIMTLTGVSNRTAPVRRGMWVLERILCAPPPPPPEEVIAELRADMEFDESITERERLALHRVEPTCAHCHYTMDAIGLGFENYDAIGAYREAYGNGLPIDASGVLPGSEARFDEPLELVALLGEDLRLQGCVVRQLLTYGAGRVFESRDDVLVDLVRSFAGDSEATFQSVLNGVILSDGFRRREVQ